LEGEERKSRARGPKAHCAWIAARRLQGAAYSGIPVVGLEGLQAWVTGSSSPSSSSWNPEGSAVAEVLWGDDDVGDE
jgi:hypothetical protein